MTVTAGALTQLSVTATTAKLSSAAATLGVGPYTYQWYRSTTMGFTPGGGNILAGKTALTLDDSGLIPNTTYYYVVKATDTGNSNVTDDSSELAVVTAGNSLSQNQFRQSTILGQLDLHLNFNTISVQIDASQVDEDEPTLYAGSAVKMVDSAGGVPKVLGCDSNDDEVLGFINYDIKSQSFVAGQMAEISMAGNVMYLYAGGAIARGAQVTLEVEAGSQGTVVSAANGDTIVGWAVDKASAYGQLIRVMLSTPSFQVGA